MNKTINYTDILASNIAAIGAAMAPVRASIGPKGLDVMLVDELGGYSCTNDGVEILSNIKIEHPAAKLAVEAAKSQEAQVGDGTSTVAILCDSMLHAALDKINSGANPNRLAQALEIAARKVQEELRASAMQVNELSDPALRAITKIAARGNEDITGLILEALYLVKDAEKLASSVFAQNGHKSQVLEGHFIKKRTHFNYSHNFEQAPLLLIQGPLEPEPMSSEAVNTDEGVRKYENNIQVLMETAKKIAKAGIKAVISSSSMFARVEEFFAREGIFVLTHVKESDIRILEEISGTQITTRSKLINSDIESIKTLSNPLTSIRHMEDLGGFVLRGPKSNRASILISAQTPTILDERRRITIDACRSLAATTNLGYVLGEGVCELNLIPALVKLQDEAQDEETKLGIEIMVAALGSIFDQIVSNAGFNSAELQKKLKNPQDGIDLDSGSVINLVEAGVLDPLEVKLSAFRIATEIASQILRINMIVQAR